MPSRLNLAPTKSNQLAVRRDLAMAAEGFSLLDQKREILVMELMRLLERVRTAEAELKIRQQEAYQTLKRALAQNGFHRLCGVAAGVHYKHRIRTASRVAAGVRIPEIEAETDAFSSQFSFGGADSLADRTMQEFLRLLQAVGRMAQLETAVWQLARELKRTQRRVNALEQIFIPSFRATLTYIGDTLESKELESFFVLKLIKRQIVNKNADERGQAG